MLETIVCLGGFYVYSYIQHRHDAKEFERRLWEEEHITVEQWLMKHEKKDRRNQKR